jgi:mRNA degradation ribonuclease J1/J2
LCLPDAGRAHLNKNELANLLSEIKAKTVFPIHTENQHLFKKLARNVQTIEYATEYNLQ